MIKNLAELLSKTQDLPPATIVIACAATEEIAVAQQALAEGIANFILIGDEANMRQLVKEHQMNEAAVSFIHETNEKAAAEHAIALVRSGKADFPMKGLMHTGTFMGAVLNKEKGLMTGSVISQITVFDGYNDELQYLTDCAIAIAPDLKMKQKLIENAVSIARELGNPLPLVALLGSVETINPAMPDTLESAALTQMNRRGQIANCIVDGPLALDNAISQELAAIKGIDSPVAGKAQILVAPDLGVANTLSKGITHYANKASASIIAGTSAPIVMTSRTDKEQNKLYAIAAACYLAQIRRK